ncbi:MAG TPA: FHA domain-containing protein [Pirellulales bacterium]|nr:FHA domain-containing protein [Pirellulales bacterium]
MAVGITILSGTRQGERLEFDLPEFRAGDTRACELFFDPMRDRAARGCQTLFRLDNEGWSVKNVGGGQVLVNDRPVQAGTRLRSGDVVRLSPAGPDFMFHLLARVSAPAIRGRAAGDSTAPHPPAAAKPPEPSEPAPGPGDGWDNRRTAFAEYPHGQGGPEIPEPNPQDACWDSLGTLETQRQDGCVRHDDTPATGDLAWENPGAPATDEVPGSENHDTTSPSITQLALVVVASALVVLGLLLVSRR